MSLGLCCQFVMPRTKRDGTVVYENVINEKSLQLGRFKSGIYSPKIVLDTYRNNVVEIINLIPRLVKNNIKCFRLSSGLLPLFDLNHDLANNDEKLIHYLGLAGNIFKTEGIRVTCHPGQFTVLSSESADVVNNSITELNYHAWIFDKMGFDKSPFYAINIHGGKSSRVNTLIESIGRLDESVRSRLTLENDETCYSVKELLEVFEKTGVPIVFDSHHHGFNHDNMTMDEAYQLSVATWKNHKPLQHISNTIPGQELGNFKERRKHSDYIHHIPDCQLVGITENKIDLEIEAKMKNFAISEIRKQWNIDESTN